MLPKNVVYVPFYGFVLKNIEFPQVEMLWDTNANKDARMVYKGRFFNFRKIYVFNGCKKKWCYRLPE